jgi:hypothetical protein
MLDITALDHSTKSLPALSLDTPTASASLPAGDAALMPDIPADPMFFQMEEDLFDDGADLISLYDDELDEDLEFDGDGDLDDEDLYSESLITSA